MKLTIVKSIILSVIFCLTLSQTLSAQDKNPLNQRIRGIITDKDSGEPLYSITVLLDAAQAGTMTDEKGLFTIDNVPIGIPSMPAV